MAHRLALHSPTMGLTALGLTAIGFAAALGACGAGRDATREDPAASQPPPDRDGDGVPDAEDRCVCVPEDRDGFEDGDGCPDEDNDGDGITDACDQCPDAPETVQGACDEDGCPDRSHNCVAQARVEIGEHIGFAVDSSTLDDEAVALLDDLAAALASSPHIGGVEVVGRATPGERHATALASARADATLAALVRGGVAAARLGVRAERPGPPIEGDAHEGRYVDFVIVRVGDERWPGGTPPTDSVFGGCRPPICAPVPACTASAPLAVCEP